MCLSNGCLRLAGSGGEPCDALPRRPKRTQTPSPALCRGAAGPVSSIDGGDRFDLMPGTPLRLLGILATSRPCGTDPFLISEVANWQSPRQAVTSRSTAIIYPKSRFVGNLEREHIGKQEPTSENYDPR